MEIIIRLNTEGDEKDVIKYKAIMGLLKKLKITPSIKEISKLFLPGNRFQIKYKKKVVAKGIPTTEVPLFCIRELCNSGFTLSDLNKLFQCITAIVKEEDYKNNIAKKQTYFSGQKLAKTADGVVIRVRSFYYASNGIDVFEKLSEVGFQIRICGE